MIKGWTAIVAGAGLLASNAVSAQGAETASSAAANSSMRGFAASSFLAPVAFGAEWGSFGAGVYGETLEGADQDLDGSAAVAFGLGDADDAVALEVAVISSSLTGANSDDSFGESGSIGLKLHTNLGGYASFAAGVNGTGRWGSRGFRESNESSVYAVVSKMFPVGQFATVFTVGIGNNLYNEPEEDGVGIIGSGAFYFTHWLSLIAEYTGRFANAGLSIAPLPKYVPLTITLGAVNLGEDHGTKTEFGASVGIGWSF